MVTDKQGEIGLGAETSVSLVTVRRLAAEIREAVAAGDDPRSVLAPAPQVVVAPVVTFGAFAEQYIASVESG